jgi:plasmid stabilization system protein ParE
VKNVRFDPLAKRELADTAAYYDSKQENLGDALLLEVGKALRQLSSAPLSCPILKKDIRRRPLFRFPYSIFYRAKRGEVEILAIVHQRRGPKYIAERIRGNDAGEA